MVGNCSRCWRIFMKGRTTEMKIYTETNEEFRHRCLTNRANRTSDRSSKYANGSSTFMKTKARLSKSLGREETLVEMFNCRTNHNNIVIHESYAQRVEVATQQSQQSRKDAADGSAASVVDPDAAQELDDYQKKYQKILTRVTETDDLRLEWREQLERLQRMEAHMKVYQAQMRAAGIIPASGTQTSLPSALPNSGHGNDEEEEEDYLDL
ncbi:hypothetical protein Ahy_B08g092267 [Arachis hypogaea]|uniref:Uncharacterized protein n=1 Tax=Arachis hypogaea TaxID=3818 RepID=A0A444Y3K1_ARAHY|nr:hypothetical protein Ahy_B08g092267 [Arachis hypogaea]